jgi:3-hydroxyacyl-CoA dehydrogenase
MSLNKQVRRIAIIGTGVFGASWAAQYLARGFDVIVTNPNPNAESQLRKDIDAPLGLYQGVTEQVAMSRTPGSFRTVLVPRGSSKPEWE